MLVAYHSRRVLLAWLYFHLASWSLSKTFAACFNRMQLYHSEDITSLASVSGSHFHFLLNSIYYFLKLFHLIIFSFDYNVGWWICISFSGLFYISSPYPSNWWCCIFNYAAYQKKPNKSTKRKTRQAKALENAKKAPRTFLELLQEVRAKNEGAVARFLLLTAAIK